eukprot:sb/3461585/
MSQHEVINLIIPAPKVHIISRKNSPKKLPDRLIKTFFSKFLVTTYSHEKDHCAAVNDLQESMRGKNTAGIKMKQTLVEKEKDRDTLLTQLDEKTEKLYEMNQKFLKQQNELQVLTLEIRSFEDKFREQKMQSGQKVQEAEGLRKQITQMVDEISQLEAVRDRTLKHNKQLNNDVKTMTGETQRLNEEIRGLKKQLELMRKDVNEKAAELHNIHHVVGLKDADNVDILNRYQEINVECDRLARDSKINAENCRALQRDLAATQDVRTALERRLKEQTLEIQKLVEHSEELQRVVTEGDLQIEELREMCRRGDEEREQILLDLETVRQINSKIEGQREAHARQAANRGVEVWHSTLKNARCTLKLYPGQSHTESQVSHLKTVASTAQRSRDDLHNKLQEVSMELELANQRNTFLDKQVNDLQESMRGKNTAGIKMKQTLVEKEKDRDTLLTQLDEKTEKLYEMNQKFLKQQNELQVLTLEIRSFENKFREQKMQSGQKVQEAEGLRKQITQMVDEISQLEAVRDRTLKHNKQLNNDVKTMTGETQRLNEEIRGLKKQLELMRKDVNEKAAELYNIHHVVGLKDADNVDILNRYQEINVECDRLARDSKINAENCRALQRDLAATQDVRTALERRLKEQTLEIQKLVEHSEELQRVVTEGDLQIEELREMCRRGDEEREQILLDLETVRQINSKIEGQREAHARQAANRPHLHLVNVSQYLLERRLCESLKRQVAAEKDCARNLEYIIKTSRQQEFDNQTSVEDLHGMVNHLKAKLQLKETELAGAREQYQLICNEHDNLKQENATLLRNVTDERFEREKAKNESNILKHKLAAASPKPPSSQQATANKPPPLFERPVSYEPTLSPSVVRKRTARRVHVSSADETDDSIMREINRSMKSKITTTPAAGVPSTNVSSIMTSLTETSFEDQTLDSERPVEHSIDSLPPSGPARPSPGRVPVREKKDSVVESELSRHSSVVVDDGMSEATFDGDEDDSVYQAIKSSQRSGGIQQ